MTEQTIKNADQMPPGAIRLLALDLDGTLTNSEKKISEGNREALFAAMRQGVRIVLASGRPLLGMRRLSEELRLSENGGFLLAFNGGQIIDCKTGTAVFEARLPREVIPELERTAAELSVPLISYDAEHIYSATPDARYVRQESFCCSAPVWKTDSLSAVFSEEGPPKVIAADEPERLLRAAQIFRNRFGERLNIFFSERYFLEITPRGVDKAAGLSRLADYLGLSEKEMMAMGDGMNDVPMMRCAGWAVAMGNAFPEVKREADAVTESNDEDGVARAVERYILRDRSF